MKCVPENKRRGTAKPDRKPYSTPKLRVVTLAAREVLAIGCKTSSSGPSFGNPTCSISTCTLSDSS